MPVVSEAWAIEALERIGRAERGDVRICAQCFAEATDLTETDEEGVFWTYCRACDFWTEHPRRFEGL